MFFDYQRRTNSEFRRQLRRNDRRKARLEKEEAAVAKENQKKEIYAAVDRAKAEGFPTDVEAKEAFFLSQLQEGEQLAADPNNDLEAALAFYKAMKVYPRPGELINIYDKSFAQRVLNVLSVMIAYDGSLDIGQSSSSPFRAGPQDDLADIPRAGLD